MVLYPYKSDVTDYMYVYYEDDKVVAYEILVIADDISLVEEFISERYRYLGEIYGLPCPFRCDDVGVVQTLQFRMCHCKILHIRLGEKLIIS